MNLESAVPIRRYFIKRILAYIREGKLREDREDHRQAIPRLHMMTMRNLSPTCVSETLPGSKKGAKSSNMI